MSFLQQRERERELERETERERERDKDRSTEALRELEAKVQVLVEQGLVRMERSASGHLDIQVVPVIQHVTQKGLCSACWSSSLADKAHEKIMSVFKLELQKNVLVPSASQK